VYYVLLPARITKRAAGAFRVVHVAVRFRGCDEESLDSQICSGSCLMTVLTYLVVSSDGLCWKIIMFEDSLFDEKFPLTAPGCLFSRIPVATQRPLGERAWPRWQSLEHSSINLISSSRATRNPSIEDTYMIKMTDKFRSQ
jgi:hypothetical protein